MKRSSVLDALGLARRAGAVVAGVDRTRTAIREGRARVVLIATDGAEGQVSKLLPLLENRGTPHWTWGTQDELGGAIGAPKATALAVVERGLAEQVMRRLDEFEGRP